MNFNDYKLRTINAIHDLSESQINFLIDSIVKCWMEGRTVFVCGNGGSACTANHFAEDLATKTGSLKVLSLCTNVGWITAIANDIAYGAIFTEQLEKLAEPGDLLVAISCSGSSPNVVGAAGSACARKVVIAGLTANCGASGDGGALRALDQCIHIEDDDFGIAESIHLSVLHYVVDRVRDIIKNES